MSIERPDREPDIVLPENEDFYAVELWIEENISLILNGDNEIKRGLYKHNNKSVHVIDYLKQVAEDDDEGRGNQKVRAQEFLIARELHKAIFEE